MVESAFTDPEYTLKRFSFPAKGSAIVLNMKAEKGASSLGSRVSGSPVLGFFPWTEPLSKGEGKQEIIRSRSSWIPMFRVEEPQTAGTNFLSMVPFRRHLVISSMDT